MPKVISNMIKKWDTGSASQHAAAQKRYPKKYAGVSMLMNRGGGSSSSSGGGSSSSSKGGGGDGSYASMFANYLKYGPQMAEMDWQQTSKYLPLQAALQLQLAGEYLPQQNQLELDLANRFQPQYTDLYGRLRNQDRGMDLDNIEALTPQLDTIRRLSEGGTMSGMRDTLQQQIFDDLQRGEKLGTEQRRQSEEYFRSGEFARGLGTGGGSAAREAIVQSLEGRKLASERQAKAQSVMSQDAQERYDPFMAIGGRPSTAMGMGAASYNSPRSQPTYAGNTPNGLGYVGQMAGLAQNQQSINNQASQFNQQFGLQQQQYNLQTQLAAANAASNMGPSGQSQMWNILGNYMP